MAVKEKAAEEGAEGPASIHQGMVILEADECEHVNTTVLIAAGQ